MGKEAKKPEFVPHPDGHGEYDVLVEGKSIGTVVKVSANKWVANTLTVKTRNDAYHILEKLSKAKSR